MTSHFSLNIKTLSPVTDAMVLSIGVCKFTKEKILETFHISLSLEDQKGRAIDTERFHWWLKQYKERDIVQPFPEERYGVRSALKSLNIFIREQGSIPPDPHTAVNIVWMRGVQFDWAILENLAHEHSTGLVFQHNALRDQRTFCDEHVQHEPVKTRDALDDAIYHALQVQRTLQIKGEELR